MAQEWRPPSRTPTASTVLNEVPEHMAQEFFLARALLSLGSSSMKFLSTWLRNALPRRPRHGLAVLNEVPEHMAQESAQTMQRVSTRNAPQ